MWIDGKKKFDCQCVIITEKEKQALLEWFAEYVLVILQQKCNLFVNDMLEVPESLI